MLAALLKLGVLNPAGASVAEFAAVPTSPCPNAVNAANRQEQTRTFLRGGMSMSFLQKTRVAYARARRKLADRLTSHPQNRDGTRAEGRSPVCFQTGLCKDYSHSAEKTYLGGACSLDGITPPENGLL